MSEHQDIILVVGGAGKFAGSVTRAVAMLGGHVRALVRSEEAGQRALALGAREWVLGDLHDIDSCRKAADDAAAIFHIGPAFLPDEAQVGWSMINFAKEGGAKRFVYLSALHPIASRMINHDVKRQVEERLVESGLAYTILQPARFMQGVMLSWPRLQREAVFAEPFSADSPMAFVDFDDVAEAAAICLTQPGYQHATFELSGNGMLDRHQMVAIMSRVLGRQISAETADFDAWTAALPRQPYLLDGLRRMMRFYDRFGFPGGNSRVLELILGRPATGYEAFFKRFASAMQASA